MAYLLLAALSTPLVLSVHSVVSFDFATSVVPDGIPPYFHHTCSRSYFWRIRDGAYPDDTSA